MRTSKNTLKTISKGDFYYKKNGNVMVPLRAVAEKMGYTVGRDNENHVVTVGNDTWKIELSFGIDSYVGVTKIKDAVGMTAPQSYGAVPELIENTTFVPAKMFELIDYKYNAIGQFVNFEKTTSNNAAQISNPFVSYDNIDEAKKALNFEPSLPAYIPEEFSLNDISVMENDFLQLSYKDKANNKLSFRTSKTDKDISGDYNTYRAIETIIVNNFEVTPPRQR